MDVPKALQWKSPKPYRWDSFWEGKPKTGIGKLPCRFRSLGWILGKSEVFTWILHESEAFICKALKGEAIVHYAEPLITKHMEASGSPAGWKLMRLNRSSSFLLNRYWALLLKFSQPDVILILFHHLINFHARFRYEFSLIYPSAFYLTKICHNAKC